MAVGNPVIATAAIGLVPTISGVRGNIASQLASSSVMRGADQAGRSVGSRLGSTITSTLKSGLKIGGVITAAVAGLTLKGGINRALGIEDARAKMSGLGHDTQTVEKIMGNALASVEGTSFGLDAAATTAAGAVAAGIKPGEQLEQTLSTVANTAAAAGTGMDEIGGIFNTVAAVGAAYTGDINMIAQRGIPIWQSLSDTLGVSQEEVKKMATEGAIDFATFETAAADAAGGVATAMGDTTRGSIANMLTSFSKLGADVVSRFLPVVKAGAQGIQATVGAITKKLGPILDQLFGSFTPAATAGVEGFFAGLVSWIEAFDPQPMIDFFGRVGTLGKTVFAELKGGITAFGAAWAYNDGEVTSSGFPGFMERAAYFAHQLWDSIKELDFSSFSGFIDSLGGFDPSGIGSAFSGVGGSLSQIAAASPTLLASGLEVLGTAMQFLADHSDTLVQLLPYIVAGFVAYKVATQGLTAAVTAQRAADLATLPVQIARNVTSLASAVARNRATMSEIRLTAATNVNTATTARATIAERARTLATNIGAAASKAAALATRLLGAAIRFATGPIGLIITGVTLLAAGLVYFFTKTETGQKMWTRIWGAIKGAALAVVDWFTSTALPLLQSAWNGIAAGALWLYQNAILPAWAGIKTAIAAVGTWITGTLWPALQTAWSAIGAAAMWLYTNVIQPAWTGIKTAIAIAVTAVLVYIDLLKWYFSNVIAPVALWLWRNVITPAWNGIQAAIGAVVSWVQNTAWPMLKAAWDAIAAAAQWLYSSVILPVWNAIKGAISAVVSWMVNVGWPALKLTIDAIANAMKWLYNNVISPVWNAIRTAISAVVSWLQNTAWPLISTVIGWLQTSFNGWKLLAQAVWSAIQTAINAVVAWFRDTAWPLISSVIGSIKSAFNTMRDSLKSAWNFIKDSVIAPVANWFRDTIKPLFDTVTGGIADAFDLLKDTVKTAWDKIRDTAKAPVKFLVETIIRDGIIKKYNDVANGVFGLDKIDTGKFTVGWSSGGYTGPGSKYQPAGVVHADEYVIRKESQNSLRRAAPGFLDDLNKHGVGALGYAGGGLVKLRNPFAGSYPRGEGFGARGGRHKGIDWPMPSGAVLKAVGAGHVAHTSNAAAGNKLNLTLGNGLVAGYHHLSSYIAGDGSSVGRGTDVARVGSTGRSSGPHLHFSLKKDGTYVDPAPYLGAGGEAGSGGGSWWNPFDGLWDSLKSKVREGVGDSGFGNMLFEVPQKVISGAVSWATDKLTGIFDGGSDGGSGGAGVDRWRDVASQALQMKSSLSPVVLDSLMRRMNQESGGNPRAINNWDSNAAAGMPSKGLMQVIPPTFDAYAEPGYGKDIYDPLSNILASINYTKSAYGSLTKGWNRKGGYADGGLVKPFLYDQGGEIPPGVRMIANRTSRPEKVLPPGESVALSQIADALKGRGGPAEMSLSADDRELLRAIADAVDLKVDGKSVVRTVKESFRGARTPLVTT